jgi:hypothetical protein
MSNSELENAREPNPNLLVLLLNSNYTSRLEYFETQLNRRAASDRSHVRAGVAKRQTTRPLVGQRFSLTLYYLVLRYVLVLKCYAMNISEEKAILTLDGSGLSALTLLGKEPPIPIGQKAGWAPELFWTRCRLSNFFRHSSSSVS